MHAATSAELPQQSIQVQRRPKDNGSYSVIVTHSAHNIIMLGTKTLEELAVAVQ